MIEMTLQHLMIWILVIVTFLLGVSHILSWLRQKMTAIKHKRNTLYCNVCVRYFYLENEEKYVNCPQCQRRITRGRNRKMG